MEPKQAPTNSYTAASGRAMQAALTPNNTIQRPQTPTPQPTISQPVIQQPSVQQPIIQQPTTQQPITQQPVIQQTTMQQSIAQQPTMQQPISSQPAAPVADSKQINTDNPLSTQATLVFSELRDSLVIMKDGSFRAVVACQSINFDLMSSAERESVEYSYQNFLNSLNFPIQILIRSQKVDISPYINRLSNLRRENDNMLLGVLMDDYLQFIQVLAQEANIMDKSFFIVIPYYSSPELAAEAEQTKNFFRIVSRNASPPVTRINRDVYNKAIEELNNRVETVMSGLFQVGIQSVRLNTRELSELFYNFNNPDTAVHQPLVDFTEVATTFVTKGKNNV